MFLRIITTKTKALFFFFLSLIRRALCCFRRRRRPSGDGEPLTHVGVVSSSARTPNEPPQEWTDWNVSFNESKPNTVQDHIEMYRKQLAAARQAQEEKPEEQRDLFGDMAPKITKQKKVFVDKSQSEGINSNRLSLAPDELGVTIREGELGEWDENSGWESETLDWSVKVALHEKKKQERERRLWEQQQKRQERMSNRPVPLGARVSS